MPFDDTKAMRDAVGSWCAAQHALEADEVTVTVVEGAAAPDRCPLRPRTTSAGQREQVVRAGWAALVAALVFLASSLFGALFLVAARGRGSGDVPAFAIWSLPASLLLSGLAHLLTQWSSQWRPLLAFFVHSAAGTALGIGWSFGVATSLGPWFQAFSFPVAPLWTIASGLACVGAALASRREGWRFAGLAACIPVAVVLVMSQASPPRPPDMLITLRSGATQDDAQTVLETVICRRVPGKGHRPLPGIATIAPWDVEGRKRFKIGFHRGMDAPRREQLRQDFMASDLVEAVEEIPPLK